MSSLDEWKEIILQLPIADIIRVLSADRSLHQLDRDEHLWKLLVERDFRFDQLLWELLKLPKKTWKSTYTFLFKNPILQKQKFIKLIQLINKIEPIAILEVTPLRLDIFFYSGIQGSKLVTPSFLELVNGIKEEKIIMNILEWPYNVDIGNLIGKDHITSISITLS